MHPEVSLATEFGGKVDNLLLFSKTWSLCTHLPPTVASETCSAELPPL